MQLVWQCQTETGESHGCIPIQSSLAEAYNVEEDEICEKGDSVFDESDLQFKSAELDQLHDLMQEKLKNTSYPQKIQILTLVPDKWANKLAAKLFGVSE